MKYCTPWQRDVWLTEQRCICDGIDQVASLRRNLSVVGLMFLFQNYLRIQHMLIYSHILKNVKLFLQSLFCLDFPCDLILSVPNVAVHIYILMLLQRLRAVIGCLKRFSGQPSEVCLFRELGGDQRIRSDAQGALQLQGRVCVSLRYNSLNTLKTDVFTCHI